MAKKSPLYFSLGLLLWMVPLSGYAQNLSLKHFSASDQILPLPSQSIYTLCEDEFGYIWMSAYGAGIARYNGNEFQLFGPESGVPSLVVEILQDEKGRLWVCGRNKLVVSNVPLNSQNNDSIQFVSSLDGIDLLENFSFKNTCIDPKGRIWASDDSVLVRYSYNAAQQLEVDTLLKFATQVFPHQLSNLFAQQDGSIWGNLLPEGDLIQFDPDADHFRPLDTLETSSSGKLLSLNYEDARGGLWLNNAKEYLYLPPEKSGQQSLPGPINLGGRLTGITQLTDSLLVGAVTGIGMVTFSVHSGQVINTYGLSEGFSTLGMLDLHLDANRNLWIAHAAGLDRVSADFRAFGAYTAESQGASAPFLPEAGVNVNLTGWKGFEQKEDQPLVLAGTTKGLAILSEEGAPQWIGHEGEFLSPIVLGLATDSENRLWISSTVQGMNCLYPAGKTGDFPFKGQPTSMNIGGKKFQLGTLASGYLYFPRIISLPQKEPGLSSTESLWGVSRSQVQFLFKGKWIWFNSDNGFLVGTPNAITDDNKGTIFIGGSEGLIKTKDAVRQEQAIAIMNTAQPHDSRAGVLLAKGQYFSPIPLVWNKDSFKVVSTLLWHEGNLWAGVSGGMLVLDGESFESKAFIPLEEVDPGSVCLSPRSENIWVGSASGLFEIDSKAFKVLRRTRKADGLLSETNWGVDVLSASQDGTLFYGTTDGLMKYKPWLDQIDSADFQVYVQEISYKEDRWGKNELTLRYAALAFRDEASIMYKTRLIGYDEEWSAPSKNTSIRYTNLSAIFLPKTYRFEVQAKDYRGIWKKTHEEYEIIAKPPYWLSFWAFMLYAFFIGALVQAYTRWQVKQQLRKRALEEAKIIRQQRDEIQKQNQEKELLLKEIHHRVKNNLQTVSSLLNLQSEHIEDDSVKEAVAEGQHRVQSMALIHQKLYQRENLAAIEMKDYLGQLGEGLLESFGVDANRVQIKLEMQELELDVDSAIPIGLIVNELLTNSLKYAFPDERKGEITLSLDLTAEKILSMKLKDDGVGIDGVKNSKGTAFGSQLIRLLTRQLGGKRIELEEAGFGVLFTFTRFKAL